MTSQAPSGVAATTRAATRSASKPTLKRSASTASLPTPPRTQRRRPFNKRALLHGTESDIAEDSDVEEEMGRNKKRRLEVVSENDKDAEDAFWSGVLGDSDVGLSSPTATPKRKGRAAASTSAKSPATETESPVPMLTRRRKAEASGSALLSPPPSHRKSVTVRKTKTKKQAVATLPVIAEDKDPFADDSKVKDTPFTFRPPNSDSSNNPFLDSPEASGADTAVVKPESKPKSRGKGVRAELPMLTMVTRGQRRTFVNPYYDPDTQAARAPKPESLLPIDHPDYEPDFRCPPKVLFPQAHKKAAKKPEPSVLATPRKTPKRKVKVVQKSEWDSSDEEEGPSSKANPLLMAPGPKEQDLPTFPF